MVKSYAGMPILNLTDAQFFTFNSNRHQLEQLECSPSSHLVTMLFPMLFVLFYLELNFCQIT